jgi:hypothetical protein
MTMMNDITTIIIIRIYSNNLNSHMHIQDSNHHAPYSTCEDHTITCPILRTRQFEWISSSIELVHFPHKSEPLNTVRT